MATKEATPSWTDVKANPADFDRAGLQVEGHFGALVRLFGVALDTNADLPQPKGPTGDIDAIRRASHEIGCGVLEEMDSLLAAQARNDD